MNLAKDPIIRRKMVRMADQIYDKVMGKNNENDGDGRLTENQQKLLDRGVIKYLETQKYVYTTFATTMAMLQQMSIQQQSSDN